MKNFELATELYLRGFNGQYIKQHTSISIQSLLKRLLKNGIKYTKNDVINYQANYIKSRYTFSDIENAYSGIISKYSNRELDRAKRGRHIEVLGCGFGSYPKVFSAILGNENYLNLRNKYWHKKQVSTVESKYGVDNVFRKDSFSRFVNDTAIRQGRIKRINTNIDRYGVIEPLQNKEICNKMRNTFNKTVLSKYGVDNPMMVPEISKKSAHFRQESMIRKYGFPNSVQIKSIRDKIFKSRMIHGTLSTSRSEVYMGSVLVSMFGENDVMFQYNKDLRYPFHVDFYIKSRDLFIELNGDRCHNTHWFDSTNVQDVNELTEWKAKCKNVEDATGKQSRYRNFVKVWSVSDVAKRQAAKNNCLNYLVFWDSRMIHRNKVVIPRLNDFRAWVDAGCPDSKDWRKCNTY